jgi:hypothetical protein
VSVTQAAPVSPCPCHLADGQLRRLPAGVRGGRHRQPGQGALLQLTLTQPYKTHQRIQKGAIGSLFHQRCQSPKPLLFLNAPVIWLMASFAAYLLVFVVVAIGNLVKGRCCN